MHVGEKIEPDNQADLERLASCIARACFSQESMVYLPVEQCDDGVAKVIYTSKDGKTRQAFDAMDYLAQLVVHIPDR